MVNTGAGKRVDIDLPLAEHGFTLISDWGYVEAEPIHGETLPLLEAARADGIDRIAFEGVSLNTGGMNLNSMSVLAWSAGLDVIPEWEEYNLGPNGVYLFRGYITDVKRAPCVRVREGYGLYFSRGGGPGEGRPFYCPRERSAAAS
jgi:hypothetical protein